MWYLFYKSIHVSDAHAAFLQVLSKVCCTRQNVLSNRPIFGLINSPPKCTCNLGNFMLTTSSAFFAQFLPDDDEAASMFTVVIDKEIAQQEKKKKTAAAAGKFLHFDNLNSLFLYSS